MRKKRNEIIGICNHDGVWTTDRNMIDTSFETYFKDIFSSSNLDFDSNCSILQDMTPKVSDSMNAQLLAPFTRRKIERAIKQMHPSKAPGPDGFPACFIRNTGLR